MKKFSTWWEAMRLKSKKWSQNAWKRTKDTWQKVKTKCARKAIDPVSDGSIEEQSNEEETPKPEIVEFRPKRRFHMPSLIITGPSSKWKKGLLIAVPCALAITGITLGVVLNQDSAIERQVVLETNKTYHRVYLLSSDQWIVPLSVKMEQRKTIQEEMLEVFACLKTNTKLQTEYLRGYIPSETTLHNLHLEQGVLTLNMSTDFLNYEETQEWQMLESLVHTFTEFPDVETLKLQVDGQDLKIMPKQQSVIPETLSRQMGINRSSHDSLDILQKDRTVIYYNRSYDAATSYMIPLSVYTDRQDNLVESFYNALDYRPSFATGLKKIDTYNLIDTSVSPMIHDDGIVVGVTTEALMEEGIIHQDIYELLVLSFDLMGLSESVSLQVDGESYQVNGYADDDSVAVSSIVVNSVAI